MALPSHFSSILLSNWQSAVAKTIGSLTLGHGVTRSPVDFQHPTVLAATVAAHSRDQEDQGASEAVDLDDPEHRQARTALDLAMDLVRREAAMAVAKTKEDVARAEAIVEEARFGTISPLWVGCVLEFYEHYKLTQNARVPYVEYVTLNDFVYPTALPTRCKVAIFGDWGTGEPRAQALLEAIAASEPDVVIHLGDIYYSCTPAEANRFYENVRKALGSETRLYTLCGNHDMYSGAAPYYALTKRLGQPASFFCLRNSKWQIIAGDTGYNDFKPLSQGADATWIRDRDEGDTYSELDWHKDKLIHAGGRKTILLTHHQLFSRNSAINHDVSLFKNEQGMAGFKPVNEYLHEQFEDYLPEIALWIWGHEHNQVIYEPFAGLQRGRCVGASAIPVPVSESLYSVSDKLQGQDVPALMGGDASVTRLQADGEGLFYQLGYAVLSLDSERGSAEYFQFDPVSKRSTSMFREEL